MKRAPTPIGKRPFALWIGVLHSLKRPLQVIDIAKMIPEVDFVIVGWTEDKSIAARLETEKPGNLYYLGVVSEYLKRDLIENCFAGLSTSKYEGFGWTPFEFLAAGKPVVVYGLEVFKEVYDDLVIYADDIADFARHLRRLCNTRLDVSVDIDAVTKRQARYDLSNAASNIMRRLGSRSLIIFVRDVPIGQNEISGFHLVNWRLCKLMRENGAELDIFSNVGKFATSFGLADRTMLVGSVVERLHWRWETLRESSKSLDIAEMKMVDFLWRTLEPLYYVYRYAAKRRRIPSKVIVAAGQSQIFAGIIAKYLFGLKLACLEHDSRSLRGENKSVFNKIYYLCYAHALQHADVLMTVSNTMRKEFLECCPFYEDRLMVIWGEDQ